jgi:opacity protein-like surface antigen
MLKKLLLTVSIVGLALHLHAQVAGSAQGPAPHWYIGAEYSRLNPDYWTYPTTYMNGFSLYGGRNVYVRHRLGFGLEGTWRTLLDRSNGTHREDSYLLSGRFLYRINRFSPFIKGGGGFGDFNTKNNPTPGQNGIHLIGAVGAGLDVRLTSRIYIRPVEWEQQVWTFSPHLLAPHSWSFGAAYRFH